MSEFETLMASTHDAIEAHFGDPYRVERASTGERAEPVQLIVDHGVLVDTGEAPTRNSTVEYRRSVVGALDEGDLITRLTQVDDGYALTNVTYVLGHEVDTDGDLITRVIYRQTLGSS